MDTLVDPLSASQARDQQENWQLLLPADLQDWVAAKPTLASRLSETLTAAPAALTETAAWDMIAGNYSPEWSSARATLKSAEHHLNNLLSPENMPLGPIGAALHSDETNEAERQHRTALVDFTIVNESLRQQDELHRLLGAVMTYQHMIGKSLEVSKNAAGISNAFADAIAPQTPEAGADFTAAAGKKAKRAAPAPKLGPKEGLSLSFRQMTSRLLGKPVASRSQSKVKAPEASL